MINIWNLFIWICVPRKESTLNFPIHGTNQVWSCEHFETLEAMTFYFHKQLHLVKINWKLVYLPESNTNLVVFVMAACRSRAKSIAGVESWIEEFGMDNQSRFLWFWIISLSQCSCSLTLMIDLWYCCIGIHAHVMTLDADILACCYV